MFKPTKLWALTALLLIVPFTALLHHRIFYPQTCILNPFGFDDYDLGTVSAWLRMDPSPRIAVVMAALVYVLGGFVPQVRIPTAAFIIAFIPLSVWLWDIPFSGRFVCHMFHDGRSPLHTRHLYIFGMAAWVPTGLILRRLWPRPV